MPNKKGISLFLLFFCCFYSFRGISAIPGNYSENIREKRQFVPQPIISPSSIPYGQFREGAFCFSPIMPNMPFRCALITTRPANWYSAQQYCQQRFGGAGLFSVQSEGENRQLLGVLGWFRQGLTILGAARSFWLGMICQCQYGQPFSCSQCQWADGHQMSAYSAPPTNIFDQKIGPLWSRGYYNDHFWRAIDGKMCLFATEHWALYDCGFLDPNGGFVCEVPYNLAIQMGALFSG